jgi:hypothetical protein
MEFAACETCTYEISTCSPYAFKYEILTFSTTIRAAFLRSICTRIIAWSLFTYFNIGTIGPAALFNMDARTLDVVALTNPFLFWQVEFELYPDLTSTLPLRMRAPS